MILLESWETADVRTLPRRFHAIKSQVYQSERYLRTKLYFVPDILFSVDATGKFC